MMNLYKEAGQRIYLTRVMRGYTRECLAELASISAKFLYEIETGKKGFSAFVLNSLCESLEVDSDFILTGKRNSDYDKKLAETLQLFNEEQTAQVGNILKEIYDLLNYN